MTVGVYNTIDLNIKLKYKIETSSKMDTPFEIRFNEQYGPNMHNSGIAPSSVKPSQTKYCKRN